MMSSGEEGVAPKLEEPEHAEPELAEPDGTEARYDDGVGNEGFAGFAEVGAAGSLLAEPVDPPSRGGGGFRPSDIWTGSKSFLRMQFKGNFGGGRSSS